MFRRHAAHVHSFSVSSAFLVLALLLAGSPLHAQQPDRSLPERLAPDRGKARASSERVRTRTEALTRRRAQPFTPASLTNTPANLFTRAGAGLTGVQEGSSTLGDVDGDGTLDLVITGWDGSNETTTLYLGDGSGGFSEANAGLTGVEFGSSTLGDVDGDGNPDLVITGSGTATLYLGDGSGGFSEANAGLTGVERGSSTLGDVDGDGNLDLVITGQDQNDNRTSTLYLGDGSGSFNEANAGLTGVDDGSSTLGDVDGDEHLDLVITGLRGFNRTTTLYLGDGSGGFSEANAGLTGVGFGSSSTLGDVDGDEHLDLVITGSEGYMDPTTTLYLGDGSGGFSEANAGLTGVRFGSSSTLGDVDGDGDLDLVVTGLDALFGASSARVYVNRTVQEPPNQDPVFARFPEPFAVAPGHTVTRFVEAGDADGDPLSLTQGGSVDGVSVTDAGNGVAEIAFTPSRSQAGQSFTVSVEASDGNRGTATGSVTVEVGDEFAPLDAGLTGVGFGSSSTLGDVDGDGNLDLVITGEDQNEDPTSTLYLGDGSGGFSEANAELTGVQEGSSTLGDVDGDGNLDLVITGEDQNEDPTSTLYLGDGSGGFSEANAGLTGVRYGSSSTLGDVDGDGNPDLVITGSEGYGGPTTTVYLGDGSGGFSEANARLIGVDDGSSALGDVDGDGHLDLVITGYETAILYLGDGSGGFSEANAGLTGVGFGSSSTLGDVDGDGHLDLVITGRDRNLDPTTTLYLGDGSGGFSEANAGLTGVWLGSSTLGDVDGDGHLDLVITGSEGYMDPTTTVYLGDGSGGFSEANAGLTGVQESSSTLGDVDGDGNLDLVITGLDQNGDPTTTLYENLSSQNYQVASVTRTVSGDGTTAFGDTGAEIRFAASTSGSGDVTVQRFSNGPTAPRGIPEDNVSSYRFVIKAGGDLTVGDGTEVRLDVSTLDGIGDASNVTVYKRSVRGRGSFAALSTSYDGAANQLVAETDAFSEFVLASNTEPLPVELASFEANTTDEAATLRWTNASETNNAGFAVQHRADSTGAWEQLGFVESKAPGGSSPDAQTYRFRTDALDVGTHSFRLQQVDTDGTTRVSRVIQARVSMEEAFRLTTSPNPVQRQATVKVAVKTEQEVQLRLYDVLGRRLATLYDGPLPAQESHAMPLRPDDLGLSSGAYFLRLVGEDGTRTRRLTVVR